MKNAIFVKKNHKGKNLNKYGFFLWIGNLHSSYESGVYDDNDDDEGSMRVDENEYDECDECDEEQESQYIELSSAGQIKRKFQNQDKLLWLRFY